MALGYVLSLKFYPPTPANAPAVDVKDATNSAAIAVPRSSPLLSVVSGKLVLNLGLNTLKCGAGACADGKYELAAFFAASYWKPNDEALSSQAVAAPATWKVDADKVGAAALPTGAAATFYVGEWRML